MGLLDFIFPKKCVSCKKYGSYLCVNCFTYISFNPRQKCLVCNKPSFNNLTHKICFKKNTINGCFSALSYNKTTQRLISNFKQKPFLLDLKTVLSELFYESIIQNEIFNKELQRKDWILVPVPVSPQIYRKRGYNHAEILANNLSGSLKIKTFNILGKSKNKVFMKKGFEINNMNIFLIDDVVKTGFTLKQATRVLKTSGAKRVFGLILARS